MKDLRKEDEKRYRKYSLKDEAASIFASKKVTIFSMLSIALVFAIAITVTQGIFLDLKVNTWFKNKQAVIDSMPQDPSGIVLDMVKSSNRSSIPAILLAIMGLSGILGCWAAVLKTRQFKTFTSLLLTASFVMILLSVVSNIIPLYSSYLLKERSNEASLDQLPKTAREVLNLFQVNISFLVVCTIPYIGFRILEKYN